MTAFSKFEVLSFILQQLNVKRTDQVRVIKFKFFYEKLN